MPVRAEGATAFLDTHGYFHPTRLVVFQCDERAFDRTTRTAETASAHVRQELSQIHRDIATAAHDYVLLAIGDGLVAQIPALVISTAAGLMVSRVGKTEAAGPQIVTQLLRQPQSVAIAGVVLLTLGLVPAMPHVAFLLLATGLGFGARALFRRRHAQGNAATIDAAPVNHEPAEVGWDDVTPGAIAVLLGATGVGNLVSFYISRDLPK